MNGIIQYFGVCSGPLVFLDAPRPEKRRQRQLARGQGQRQGREGRQGQRRHGRLRGRPAEHPGGRRGGASRARHPQEETQMHVLYHPVDVQE